MQGIYKITNLINNKSYVGQSIDIEERFKCHVKDSRGKKRRPYNYPLPSALRKYGTDNFKFEVLELVPDRKDLTQKELFYYNLCNPKYNQLEPNTVNPQKMKKIYQWDLDGNFIAEYESAYDAHRKTKVGLTGIYKTSKKERSSAGGFLWTTKKEKPKIYIDKHYALGRKIYQYDLQGKKIAEYKSLAEASKETKVPVSSICVNAQGKLKHAGGYTWQYIEGGHTHVTN